MMQQRLLWLAKALCSAAKPTPQQERLFGGLEPLTPSSRIQQSFYASKAGKRKQSGQDVDDEASSEVSVEDTKKAMSRALEHLQTVFGTMRTGRASMGMLDLVKVPLYGDLIPMKRVGAVSVRDPQMLAVTVFDPNTLKAVEKAIQEAPLGLNPRTEAQEVLVPIPKLTRESVNAMAKLLKEEGERAKVSIRKARKHAIDAVKKLDIEDEKRRMEKQVQTETEKFVKEVDRCCSAKEKELKAAL